MSNLNELRPISKLNPFGRFCCTIGNLPSSYMASLTYDEQLMWFCDYLKNTVIPAVNNNAETVLEIQNLYIELKNYVDNYFENLDVQEEINNKLDEMAESGELEQLLEQYFHVSKSLIDLTNKTNKLAGVNWNYTNWTEVENGFHHSTGNNDAISCNVPNITLNKLHVLKFVATNQYSSTGDEALVAEFGGSGKWNQYKNSGTVTQYLSFYPTNNELIFTPSTNWEGDLLNIALYEIDDTTDVLEPALKVYDENEDVGFSTIITNAELKNISISKNALNKSTLGSNYNIAIGENALLKSASSYFNIALGYESQKENINATRNVSIGYESLREITYGDRNVAIGTFALHHLTKGRNNVGIGADSAWNTTTGNNNIAISNGALNGNTTGSGNIALGYFAGSGNTTGSQNVSIGYLANAYNTSGNHNIAIGYSSHYKGTSDTFNVTLGYQLMTENTETQCNYNIVAGYQSMNKGNGSYNIALGYQALKNTTNPTSYNIAIGFDVMSQAVTSGTEGDNIVLGHSSARKITGTNNIVLGRGALIDTANSHNVSIGNSSLKNCKGSGNIAIGQNAGDYIGNYSNTISIGNNCHGVSRDNSIQIGTVIKYNGEMDGFAWSGLDPVANARHYFRNGSETQVPIKIGAGTLKTTPEVGGLEFDGTHLYITNSSGVRKQLAEV